MAKRDYLLEAAKQIRMALDREVNEDYEAAFSYYKNGVDLLLNGVQRKKYKLYAAAFFQRRYFHHISESHVMKACDSCEDKEKKPLERMNKRGTQKPKNGFPYRCIYIYLVVQLVRSKATP